MTTLPPFTVVCASCSAKFQVADYLIRGKMVKFRCKRCKGTIECDGRSLSVTPPARRSSTRTLPPVEPSQGENARSSAADGMDFELTPVRRTMPAAATTPAAPVAAVALPSPRRSSDPFGLGVRPTADPALTPPSLATAPPTAVSDSDTPPNGDEAIDALWAPRAARRRRRAAGITIAVAACLIGWFVARPSEAPPHRSAAAKVDTKPPEALATTVLTPPAEVPAAEPAPPEVARPAVIPLRPAPPVETSTRRARAPLAKPVEKPAAEVKPQETAPSETAATPQAEEPQAPGAAAVASAMAAAASDKDFDEAAARAVLQEAGEHAASCKNIDSPNGAARVAVTFASSGRVTSAVIESGPFAGTAAGGCIVSNFKSLRIAPFAGVDSVTVHKTVTF